ncbi:zinc-dependent metalloprotease [Cellulophaga sp. F20128]|uniref:zinc-dependent metalloprotease n=1 Tax=Cellulophaga sp. F20128 TaxID=2926413 RepID=UPI001FF4B30E|nr:zinc-dependent metalloprotease [Cellulophaga sp. F20128]MCK0156350.1 zinc-dependent metalloprotease [Cellulophaga sp. F20128]
MKSYIIFLGILCQFTGWAHISSPKAYPSKILVAKSIKEQPFLKAYLVGEKLLLEIPNTLLNTEMLFVRHNTGDIVVSKHIIWTRFQDRIFLEAVRVESLTGVKIPISNNTENTRSILATFPIIKEKSTEHTSIIEISNVLLTDQIQWYRTSPKSIIKDLSFVKKVKNLSNEVLIRTTWGVLKDQARITIPVDFSFFKLPEPMAPRLFDYRMGFRAESYASGLSHKTKNSIASIGRWRLEKKDSNKAVSEPIKPIVFILSPEIPKKWRPYIRAGILAWLPAFEAAGFKNAIVVEEPSKVNSIKASFNSVNHSIVRWGNYRNVRGYESGGGASINQVVDERSGEILKSDILMGSTLQFLMDKYFIQCAPMDKRAQQYPLPDEITGELLKSLAAHEVGHSFGLVDGHYGEYAYPFDKIRDKDWLQKMGHTPSIMTYARNNNLVQPEDSIPVALLFQKVGPTDRYSIKWGYTPFNGLDSIQEKAFLEGVIREQDTVPWYRRSIAMGEIIGPGATNEVVENNDPISSATLALKNLEKVMELLPEVNKDKNDYEIIARLYDKILVQWQNQMRHVLSLIGGYDINYKAPGQEGRMYTPIGIEKQYQALDFFLTHAFNPPYWLSNPEWKKEISYSTYPDKLIELQIRLLSELVSPKRMKRLEHMEDTMLNKEISKNVVTQIQASLFKELKAKNVAVIRRRQEIQKFYLDRIVFGLEYKGEFSIGDTSRSTYTQNSKSIFRNKLTELKKEISKKMNKASNDITSGHLKLLLQELHNLEE